MGSLKQEEGISQALRAVPGMLGRPSYSPAFFCSAKTRHGLRPASKLAERGISNPRWLPHGGFKTTAGKPLCHLSVQQAHRPTVEEDGSVKSYSCLSGMFAGNACFFQTGGFCLFPRHQGRNSPGRRLMSRMAHFRGESSEVSMEKSCGKWRWMPACWRRAWAGAGVRSVRRRSRSSRTS